MTFTSSYTDPDIRFELPELNTWRLFNKGVSQAGVMHMIERWEAEGYRFGCVCVDDGWQKSGLLGSWDADPRRFPDLAHFADDVHARGYALRLWIAPAQVHTGTAIFNELWPDCFLRNRKGEPAIYVGLGSYTLDIRNPRARRHVQDVVRKAAMEWKPDAFKVDFPPFYTPDDDFYKLRDFDLPDHDKQTMVGDFFQLVRQTLDSVRPGLRMEAYPNCRGAIDSLNDMIAGDLVGEDRSWPTLVRHARKMRDAIGDRPIVPWYEMVWGEGADHPHGDEAWHAGFLEYIAASINLELKLEHSFPPFDYPNAAQIRCLSNFYGPRNRRVKVLVAGRRTFPVQDLIDAGIHMDHRTRFLVAPEHDTIVHLHTAPLRTNAIDWRCRDVQTDQPISIRSRNEFWGGTTAICRIEFNAAARRVYELWCEGPDTDYFGEVHRKYILPQQNAGSARPA